MKACFSFCQQLEARLSVWSVRDETCKDCGMAYLTLLRTLPSIGVSQNKVNIVLDGCPQGWRVSILYISLGAFIQISHEIPKHLDCRFILRKGRNIVIIDLRRHIFWTEVKFPPMTYTISVSEI